MKPVSLICCYTSEQKVDYLLQSLKRQTIEYEIILINNSQNKFSSAAKALNYGAKKSNSELLMFVHQDIKFKGNDALENLVQKCKVLKLGDVGGVAGPILLEGRYKKTKTNITHSTEEKKYIQSEFIGDYIETESIDECVIIMKKETWRRHPFDENICDHWHFYGVEQCLYARLHGGKIYTFDADINHLSERGSLDKNFYKSLKRIAKKYEKEYSYILATTGIWPIRFLNYYIVKRIIGEKIRRMRR